MKTSLVKCLAVMSLFVGFAFAAPLKPKTLDAKDYFENAAGCFLLYNMKTNTFEKVIGEENCRVDYPAASTFKVPLAVMAFDSGALKDETEVLKWDGKKDVRPEANHDQDAKSWMRDSIVWFSQRLTPKIGEEKLQAYLNSFNYGNKDLKAGITQAWLVAPNAKGPALKITAYEQVDFMKKLWTNSLSASPRSMKLTQDITYLETSPDGFKLNGKTGSSFYDKSHKLALGWFVAHLEKDGLEYIVVTNFRDLKPTKSKSYGGLRAKETTKKILGDLKLW
ncbi:MAG: class D beta-lactamase [Bdellovibrionales bacterium]|nr:class D beta-lactamase [Bdellovibrionales bacterium]